MADNKIRLPSGQAGLTRYDEEYHSKFVLSPKAVFILIAVIVILIMALLANNGALGYRMLGLA